jgi:hypothetical protein
MRGVRLVHWSMFQATCRHMELDDNKCARCTTPWGKGRCCGARMCHLWNQYARVFTAHIEVKDVTAHNPRQPAICAAKSRSGRLSCPGRQVICISDLDTCPHKQRASGA